MEMPVGGVLRKLADQGFRLTKTRKLVVELVFTSDVPISAIEMQSLLEERGLRVNKTTVYRELDFLLKHSVIREVQIASELKHYESAFLEHHHHLICRSCGRIEELMSENLERVLDRVTEQAKTLGFKVNEHLLEFYGRCKECI